MTQCDSYVMKYESLDFFLQPLKNVKAVLSSQPGGKKKAGVGLEIIGELSLKTQPQCDLGLCCDLEPKAALNH